MNASRTDPDPTADGGQTAHVVDLRGVCHSFSGTPAVTDLDLQLESGELYGLVGPDGAGKSTAIRMLTGLLAPDRGEGWVCGHSIRRPSRALRQAIGYMPQQYSLYGDLSIDENLDFFGHLFGLPRQQRRERKSRLLSITRLEPFRSRRACDLSGGMYKKLALSCALLHQPRLLVLDEPTNGVDPVSRRELWDLLYEFVDEGMAVLLSSPYMDEAARCHRVGLLDRGRLLAEGEPTRLIERFVHRTFLLRITGRHQVEDLIGAQPGVLALSPEGGDIRAVVRQPEAAGFRQWATSHAFTVRIEPVAPTFEDVFLGLLKDPAAIEERGGA
ncbi:MAG: ABC transporter ATP-binding protein [Bradymonadales bacterium]|nr:ABC transporter ATP-binding protein [Bradymonadales bacterium]